MCRGLRIARDPPTSGGGPFFAAWRLIELLCSVAEWRGPVSTGSGDFLNGLAGLMAKHHLTSPSLVFPTVRRPREALFLSRDRRQIASADGEDTLRGRERLLISLPVLFTVTLQVEGPEGRCCEEVMRREVDGYKHSQEPLKRCMVWILQCWSCSRCQSSIFTGEEMRVRFRATKRPLEVANTTRSNSRSCLPIILRHEVSLISQPSRYGDAFTRGPNSKENKERRRY